MTATELAIEVGQLLLTARQNAGLSAARLISASMDKTLSRSLVSRYERGHVLIAFERLVRLLEACRAEIPSDLRSKYVSLAADAPTMAQTIVRTSAEATAESRLRRLIRLWQSPRTVSEIAEELGISRQQVHNLAAQCRRHGVLLKRRQTAQFIDWSSMRELATKELSEE